MEWTIREMCESDWEQMAVIYKEGIDTNLATFQTEVPTYEEWNQMYLPYCRYVIEQEGQIGGWVALYPVSSRHAYRGVNELSIYISNAYKGQGIGTKLLNYLIEQSESHGIWTLQSAIMQDNEVSIALHKKCGFREVGYREKIGQDRYGVWRNTVILERRSQVL